MTTNANIQVLPSASSLPAPADPAANRLAAILSSRIAKVGDRERFVGDPPTAEERAELSARLRDLNASLDDRDRSRVQRALAALFAVTKMSADDRRNPGVMITDFTPFLGDLPAWAVAEACLRIGRGEGESGTFAPAAPEIHRFAERIIAPFVAEQRKLKRILSVAEGSNAGPTADERERVAQKAKKLSELLGRRIAEMQLERRGREGVG